MLQTNVNTTENDPIDRWASQRKDGRNLISDWVTDKKSRAASFSVVQNNEELAYVNYDEVDFLLGIFANGHLSMDYKRDKGGKGQPSLEEMTIAALKILRKANNGYLLVVRLSIFSSL